MKKIILYCAIILLALSVKGIAENVFYYISNNEMQIGEKKERFYNDIYIIDDKTYVPIRELSEKLRIPILWDDEQKQVALKTDDKPMAFEGKGEKKFEVTIPDEETAYQIGKIILEKHVGKALEYETEVGVYYLDVRYLEYNNSWVVLQEIKYKKGGGGGSAVHSPTVVMNKNTGEVTFLYTDTSIFDSYEEKDWD